MAADLNSREVSVRVSGGTLSLALSGVGRGERLVAPDRATPSANGNRVAYQHAGVREWYAAGPLGIEQGFRLTQRPAGTTGPLTLALRRGSLHAQQAGSQVRFLASSGAVQARYGGLAAVDASGRRLPATLAFQGNRLLLRVSDRGARYPLRIDPFIQQGPTLRPNDEFPPADASFGYSVALSADGNTSLIGGPRNNNGVGAAWVFTRSGGTWTQQGAKLTANDETGNGGFGGSVALSADGNTALIGGPNDNSGVGAAWVFTHSDGTWTQQGAKLTANDETGNFSFFGNSVALSADGNTALIGGPNDNNGVGAAWVFTRSGGTWTQQGAKLTANDETGNFSFFGNSVALSADGNTALIGGPNDNNYAGAAWAFTRSGGTWTQQGAKFTANDATGFGGAFFGRSVALSADGSTALIGGHEAAWAFVPLLVGSPQIHPYVDSNPAGMAEAFRYTALGSGSARQLSVYLDSTNAATTVIVGLYANTRADNPGRLLTSGTITSPIAGAWNTVTVPATRVSAGTDYWLAVLGPQKAGTIEFRDLPDGGGPNQTSAQTSLKSLPDAWKTGTRYANSPASLFAAP